MFLNKFFKNTLLINYCFQNNVCKTFQKFVCLQAGKESQVGNAGIEKVQKINKAMKIYLERAKSHNEFMQEEIAEFEIGKKHLANIMGVDPENISQEEIDSAIEYLLPSGLFEKKARPKLKHPLKILPKRKDAQFGADGRPFNSFFYSGKPNFTETLYNISVKTSELKTYEDIQLANKVVLDPDKQIQLKSSEWFDKKMIDKQMEEVLSEEEYKTLILCLEQLSGLPYSFMEKDFIMTYRQNLQKVNNSVLSNFEVLPIKKDEFGNTFQEYDGKRKQSNAIVKVYDKGTGKITINEKSLLEKFPNLCDREQVLFPLHFTDKLCQVDFEATVENGGPSGQAGAIRLALSKALQSFLTSEQIEKMRLAGLLTRDPRKLERQKPGQQGARRKYTWKKR